MPRPALIAGAITGVRFAVKSLEPSLMKRSAVDQGLIMGGSFLTGFLAGATAGKVIELAPLPATGPAVRAVGVLAASARTAHVVGEHDPTWLPPTEPSEAWTEAGAEVVSALALAGVGSKNQAPVGHLTTAGAVVASTAFEAHSAIERRSDAPDAQYLATAAAVAVGLNAALAGLLGFLKLGAWLPRRLTRTSGAAGAAVGALGFAVAVGAVVGGGRTLLATGLKKIAAGNRRTEISYADQPTLNTVSGSQFSLAAYETLGLQGRRLVSEFVPTSDIEDIMGEPARHEPVRVYVGLASADNEDDRIELAIQEMKRCGGFDRSVIIAASPAGTGYVNYIAVEAAELMARGDVATVAVQYGEVPSMLSITKVPDAARVYAKLVTRLRAEIEEIGRPIRLAAYGESLGAITCQIGVREASKDRDGLIVDDALWVGTPQGSKLFMDLTESGMPVFDHFNDVRAHLDEGHSPPDVFFLNHANDPVTKFTPQLAYEMPPWLQTNVRGRGMDPNQRWLPGVAFWQGLIDTKNAATVIPGEFFSTGHDYRADLAEFVRAAYGFADVSDEQMEKIELRLRASEVSRAERIAQGKVETASI